MQLTWESGGNKESHQWKCRPLNCTYFHMVLFAMLCKVVQTHAVLFNTLCREVLTSTPLNETSNEVCDHSYESYTR